VRKKREVLTLAVAALAVLTLAVVLTVSVTAAVQFYQQRLTDPASADREELLRWLVVRDLSEESAQLRRTLAARLEEEFGGDRIDWNATAGQLDGTQRERLWQNVLLLLEPWFTQKVDGYFQLAATERLAYVDRTIDTIAVWRGVESLRSNSSENGQPHTPQPEFFPVLVERINQWQESATPEQRKRISRLLVAVQSRWLIRGLTGELSSP